MGNVTSSLSTGALGSLAKAIEEAKSDPATILDSLNTRGRNLASALSGAVKDAKADPSAALHSFNAYRHNIAASLSDTVKEVGSNQFGPGLLNLLKRYWEKAVGMVLASCRSFYAPSSRQ
jgi:hypothetical protein